MTRRRLAPRTLRGRLVATLVVLLALGFAVVALVTIVVVHRVLLDRLDAQLRAAGSRFAVGLEHNDHDRDNGSGQYGTVEGQAAGTLGARILDGRVTSAAVVGSHDATGVVTAADRAVLGRLPQSSAPHSVQLPDLGTYRIVVAAGRDNDLQVTGLPYGPVHDTTRDLVLTELAVFAAALLAVALASALLVGVTLRPLRRIATTAKTVAALPMGTGTVSLPDGVPLPGPKGSELETLGVAFNAMLAQVQSALGERHASEEQLRRFVADASHELRTPVAVVRSHAELAQRAGGDALPADVAHALRRIVDQSGRMGHMVEDLLLLARLDAGRPLTVEPVDLVHVVLDAVDDARTTAPEHRWILRLPENPVVVAGDTTALAQILANLLANARTHTPAGTTVTTAVAVGKGTVRLVVGDDGPGIPDEVVDRVFDRFVRSESTRTSDTGSSGLGLPIVAALVAAQHGTVRLDSTPGAGTRVEIAFPAVVPEDMAGAQTAQRS